MWLSGVNVWVSLVYLWLNIFDVWVSGNKYCLMLVIPVTLDLTLRTARVTLAAGGRFLRVDDGK